ncbi:ParB/RepB/Spo0J family partition protein [Streptomyces violascens]|uniref:ParB/RepB/Spo0J family partition protein n=1 Tax=Streptomyces violascens TaxID=67381 RepID=UPI001671B836|nr:hypothetical protein [Streptomyces violascens]GGU51133.1 plasmid partitioning protein [Streptomyces violascens]
MAGKRVSFADMADDEVEAEPGVDRRPQGRWLTVERCLPNPHNPREVVGDLSDLASITERQLQSCLAITPTAYLKLWPEEEELLGAGTDDVVIINGNRRRAAAVKFGRADLFVVTDDSIATSRASVLRAAYDENDARKDLDPIEDAHAVMDIVGTYSTAKEAAAAEGWSQPWISHRKNLLKIHPTLQEEVRAKARGEEGLAIRDARRLGSVKGIEQMPLAEQRKALADLLRADAEAAAAKKAGQREAKQPKVAAPDESRAGAAAASAGKEFSAENSSGGAVVPEPRPGADTPDTSGDANVSATAGAEPGSPSVWVMPSDAVREFSEAFVAEALATRTTPEAVMRAALDAIRPVPRKAAPSGS